MTTLELLDAIRTGIAALEVAPLSTFSVYIGDQIGALPAERVLVRLAGGEESPRAISGGIGVFDEMAEVELTAEFHATDDDTNRDKAYACLAQLKKFCRDNRDITAGGDKARYAGWTSPQPVGLDEEDSADPEGRRRQPLRFASIVATWKVPSETA